MTGRSNVRARSNVVGRPSAWDLVPGELIQRYKPLALRPPVPSERRLQAAEAGYYTRCGPCGRTSARIQLEGCTQCAAAPRPAETTELRAHHDELVLRARALEEELNATLRVALAPAAPLTPEPDGSDTRLRPAGIPLLPAGEQASRPWRVAYIERVAGAPPLAVRTAMRECLATARDVLTRLGPVEDGAPSDADPEVDELHWFYASFVMVVGSRVERDPDLADARPGLSELERVVGELEQRRSTMT